MGILAIAESFDSPGGGLHPQQLPSGGEETGCAARKVPTRWACSRGNNQLKDTLRRTVRGRGVPTLRLVHRTRPRPSR